MILELSRLSSSREESSFLRISERELRARRPILLLEMSRTRILSGFKEFRILKAPESFMPLPRTFILSRRFMLLIAEESTLAWLSPRP